jgi:hypothetical protein
MKNGLIAMLLLILSACSAIQPEPTTIPIPTSINTPEPTVINIPTSTSTNTPVPTATNTSIPTATLSATDTPMPIQLKKEWTGSINKIPTIAVFPTQVGRIYELYDSGGYAEVPPFCNQMDEHPIWVYPQSVTIIINSGWAAKEEEQIDLFLQTVEIDLRIDGKPINYVERGSIFYDQGIFHFSMYAFIDQLEPGNHKIEQKIGFTEPYTDGIDFYGPGTKTEEIIESCDFIISEE